MRLGALFLACLAALLAAAVLGSNELGAANDAWQAVKAANSRYHSVAQAEAAGYSGENEPCVVSPGPPLPPGAMGIHFVNEELFLDPAVNALEPEIMLYEPQANGKLKLVGVEYMVRAADQTPPIDDSDRPFVLGVPLDGPMPEHAPGMGWHYDLHVWFWADNPNGFFAPFNSALSCP
jgi:hypothetical protein